MAMSRPLVAFVGPSISRRDAEAICPGLDFRPPIARGELYRERERGAWGFLIIDGVFMQHQAVSPREVVEVLQDGALVVGASSMGALRAADCWPAGARGVGLIYRLFRLGVLESDEDVAVAVNTDGENSSVSLPMVNVHYALSRAVRRGLTDQTAAEEIREAARSIFYPRRTWRAVFRRAKHAHPDLIPFCERLDLKRRDAESALRYVRSLLETTADLSARYTAPVARVFLRNEETREKNVDVMLGATEETLRGPLLEWLIGSGRITSYLIEVVAALSPLGGRATEKSLKQMARYLEHMPIVDEVEHRCTALRLIVDQVLVPLALDPDMLARAVWAEVVHMRNLDVEIMRMRTVEEAARRATRLGLRPTGEDFRQARQQVAGNYGFFLWDHFMRLPEAQRIRSLVDVAVEKMARGKRMRDLWFNPKPAAP